jgi:threonylcarbamoyladenosine tRNA methylthiotransferase MtaB
MLRTFIRNGFTQVDFHQVADVYVVNTCSVTQVAEKKCRNAIRQAVKLNPNAVIAVIGCFAQLRPTDIEAIEGVDIILGNDKKHLLYESVTAADSISNTPNNNIIAASSDDRTRCFLKIQDGCDYFCSYCTIPFARGRSRSANIDSVIAEANRIAAEGKKEIILTGINIGTFGKNSGETFFGLMQRLEKDTSIERYRISSIEPNLLTEEMIDFVANSRVFLPHFHIPLQAGTDTILKSMRRKYDTALFANRLDKIYSRMPDAFVAADVITGFPGETDNEFNAAKDFIYSLKNLSALHVFTYSERPNTLSVSLPDKVPYNIRKRRSLDLQEISQNKKHAFYNRNIGSKRKVLWEDTNIGGYIYGFTDNYIRVRKEYNEHSVNRIEEFLVENTSLIL